MYPVCKLNVSGPYGRVSFRKLPLMTSHSVGNIRDGQRKRSFGLKVQKLHRFHLDAATPGFTAASRSF
jgi:hypothetical protein